MKLNAANERHDKTGDRPLFCGPLSRYSDGPKGSR